MKLSHILLLSSSLLSIQAHAMEAITEKVFNDKVTYRSGVFNHYDAEDMLSTQAYRPQKACGESILHYPTKSNELILETILKSVSLGENGQKADGRKRIGDTTKWPYSIHTQLTMRHGKQSYAGSGVMVGPHHLLTCAHCVHSPQVGGYFDEITAYPALDGEKAVFGSAKVTRAYFFDKWLNGDQKYDMALLLLDKSIGQDVGWGAILSGDTIDFSNEKVHITGYPGDKDHMEMWSMCDKINSAQAEQFDYKIDTYGGQSGSAIWINSHGHPVIVGVHTMGSDAINSGVRISENKFKSLLLENISKNYILISTSAVHTNEERLNECLCAVELALKKSQEECFTETQKRESLSKDLTKITEEKEELRKKFDLIIKSYTVKERNEALLKMREKELNAEKTRFSEVKIEILKLSDLMKGNKDEIKNLKILSRAIPVAQQVEEEDIRKKNTDVTIILQKIKEIGQKYEEDKAKNKQQIDNLNNKNEELQAKIKGLEQQSEISADKIEQLKQVIDESDNYKKILAMINDRNVADEDLALYIFAVQMIENQNLDQLSEGRDLRLIRALLRVSMPYPHVIHPANVINIYEGRFRLLGNQFVKNGLGYGADLDVDKDCHFEGSHFSSYSQELKNYAKEKLGNKK